MAEIDILQATMEDQTNSGAKDSELLTVKKAAEEKLAQLRKLLNQKSNFYAELLSQSRILISVNKQSI